MKIACVGDCGVDQYLPSKKLYPGGITANFTRQARRSFDKDDQIYIISAIGNDGNAAELAFNSVNLPGIECYIEKYVGTTPVQYIGIKEGGEKDFVKYDEGILKNFKLTSDQTKIIHDADLIMTPVYEQIHNVFNLIMSIPKTGTIAVDFSDFAQHPDFDLLHSHIDQIDIAFFGLDHKHQILIEQIENIARYKQKLMIVTLGEHGSIAFKGNETWSCPAIKVDKIIDTTGAGDAFAAGFLAGYMHHHSTENALKKGAKIAAKTIQHIGAVPI